MNHSEVERNRCQIALLRNGTLTDLAARRYSHHLKVRLSLSFTFRDKQSPAECANTRQGSSNARSGQTLSRARAPDASDSSIYGSDGDGATGQEATLCCDAVRLLSFPSARSLLLTNRFSPDRPGAGGASDRAVVDAATP